MAQAKHLVRALVLKVFSLTHRDKLKVTQGYLESSLRLYDLHFAN